MKRATRLLIEKSWMLFVDGENFAKRGEAVLRGAGVPPTKDGPWRPDTFLWLPGRDATEPFMSVWLGRLFRPAGEPDLSPRAPRATRAYYYTSTKSDQPEWTGIRLTIREQGFEPRLFRRVQGRSKAVDLALATDVLTLAGEGQYEVAVIVAGDGDYVPVVEAVKRLGRHVVVAFVAESGLSDELRIAADDFVDVTKALVDAWAAHAKRATDG